MIPRLLASEVANNFGSPCGRVTKSHLVINTEFKPWLCPQIRVRPWENIEVLWLNLIVQEVSSIVMYPQFCWRPMSWPFCTWKQAQEFDILWGPARPFGPKITNPLAISYVRSSLLHILFFLLLGYHGYPRHLFRTNHNPMMADCCHISCYTSHCWWLSMYMFIYIYLCVYINICMNMYVQYILPLISVKFETLFKSTKAIVSPSLNMICVAWLPIHVWLP